MRIIYVLALTIFVAVAAKAQDSDLSDIIADAVEEIAAEKEEDDDETEMEQLTEHYTRLSENPLNINSATADELASLMILSDFQISSLGEYIREYGRLASILELSFVPGFDENTVMKITPFVAVGSVEAGANPPVRQLLKNGRSVLLARVSRRVEKAKGYRLDESSGQQYYMGSPFGMFVRYRYRSGNNLQLTLLADKDPGEEFFAGTCRQGFDFYGFHFMLNNRGALKRLIAGDFRAAFGQGLALWNGFSAGKSSDPHAIRKRGNVFSPYSSADEANFMRGAAATLAYGSWEISPFVSYRKVDATIDGDGYISLSANGMHRTPSEAARKNALSETVGGVHAAYGKSFMKIGFSALYGRYGADDHREIKPYNRFELHKPSNANFSADYRLMFANLSFFGEAAASSGGGIAVLSGMSVDVHHSVRFSALYRNYGRSYHAIRSNAFGAGGKASNENGFYLGLSVLPFNGWKIAARFDSYSFPWMRYGTDAPSSGIDGCVQVNYTPSVNFDTYLRFGYDRTLKNTSGEDESTVRQHTVARTHILLHSKYNLSPGLSMSGRIAVRLFDSEHGGREKGHLIYCDAKYKPPRAPLEFSLRYALFSTDSWNTRIYAYESDILYAFSVPAHYGSGCRYYLNVKCRILESLQLWFRVAQTFYFDATEAGSGLNAVEGNKQTDLKLQLQFKF
ncbi:MAG: helix-hairpin-helix domain-containing protein [Prevotellaceae bacterium]|jgi:DNA uptake protein ComE-like DNA-binding protein|nr:helix-hairpin-helix domain-containing protein [Prevotellaceae bacterium]